MENLLQERLNVRTVIFDGAMGTELYKRNFFVNVSYENLCLTAPKVIQEIHQAYKDSGAEVLTTNSYGANFNNLCKFGLGDKVAEINAASVRIAKEVAGDSLLIAGSVGPLGELTEAAGTTEEAAAGMLRDQISALAGEGADFIQFETIASKNDILRALAAMKLFNFAIPYVISCVFQVDGTMPDGTSAEEVFSLLKNTEVPPTAFGMNCGLGPDQMLTAFEKIVKLSELPVIVQPNTGAPKNVGGRSISMCSPEYFTTYCMRYVALGAKGVGGCCGTTPEDILDMARSVNPLARIQAHKAVLTKEPENPGVDAKPFAERSAFAEKLASGKWICNIEIVPPQGYDLQATIEKAKRCKEAGFDAINIPDGPRASSRVSAIVTAHTIQREAGIEAVLHQCCRDKNLIGMQGDLLGCAALGVNNILFITGDPPKLGDYPFASGVFDIDSIGLLRVQNRLNHGLDLAGKPIPMPTAAVIGAGADPNAIDMEREVRRTREKIQAGAEYIVTQPVFDPEALLKFMDLVPELQTVPLIAGIWPLASLRNAEFMKNEVPGVVVPDSVMERMAAAQTKEEQRECGIQIARESVARIRSSVAGIQVSAPFGNVEIAVGVIR
ncbi:MAG: bifunctional homocysteine S-methyltransferase/methylenetetrahydrofolate reductase [Lentisphaeria bacterium]|nr:bifunctional homocysteine S-methyltransferase/methylenetetrahydrofolate reductase [Lentisphaeria bacterium]